MRRYQLGGQKLLHRRETLKRTGLWGLITRKHLPRNVKVLNEDPLRKGVIKGGNYPLPKFHRLGNPILSHLSRHRNEEGQRFLLHG